jgi:asparagine synthase (glutamine-hydrolysing)
MRTRSDTEVILSAFINCGVDTFALLNGMFALTIIDIQERRLWLLRDRLGIKPLYFRFCEKMLAFSSEMQAVRILHGEAMSLNFASVNEWLHYGNPLGTHTLYQGLNRLAPGCYIEVDLDTLNYQIHKYWDVASFAAAPPRPRTVEQSIVQVRALLENAVARQLTSDVPVGVFLSGGVDSSAITAFASRHYSGKLASYTAAFDFEKGANELVAARAAAKKYGTEHHEFRIAGGDVADTVVKMVDHHDHPFSDAANIPLFMLSTLVSSSRKVVLQGDGGDEIFGGYSRYTTLSFLPVMRMIGRLGLLVGNFLPESQSQDRRQRYFEALTAKELSEIMGWLLTEEGRNANTAEVFSHAFRRRISNSDPLRRYKECQALVSATDIVNQMLMIDTLVILPEIFLEKVDRSTMAASIEARVPFLDNELVDYCLGMRGSRKVRWGRKKWLLKKALDGVVPDSVLYGKKTGFGVPYGHWFRKDLRELFFDQLATFESSHSRVLARNKIESIYSDHLERRNSRAFLLWKLLNFMIWANRSGVIIDAD